MGAIDEDTMGRIERHYTRCPKILRIKPCINLGKLFLRLATPLGTQSLRQQYLAASIDRAFTGDVRLCRSPSFYARYFSHLFTEAPLGYLYSGIMPRSELSDVEKSRILTLREENVTIAEIVRRTGRSRSAIMRLLAAARSLPPGTIPTTKKRPGRKRKTSQLTDRLLKLAVTRNPRLTARELKLMYPMLLKDVAIRTVQHRLRYHLNLPSRVAACKPLLTPRMRAARLKFARKYLPWTPERWRKVLWSDESNFKIIESHLIRVRRPPRTHRHDPRYTIKTVKNSAWVMVWGCFSGVKGSGSLYFLPKNASMNSERYMKVLEDHMLPSYDDHDAHCFQHDGAPCHTSKVVGRYLIAHDVDVLDWPGNSPDLNPIENCWKVMKDRVREARATSLPSLMDVIRRVWQGMDLEYYRKLADSMPTRLQAVIRARGEMTGY